MPPSVIANKLLQAGLESTWSASVVPGIPVPGMKYANKYRALHRNVESAALCSGKLVVAMEEMETSTECGSWMLP